MAKDPAINWYFDNWIGGTKGFSRFQKACYFDLLALQYYCGPLSLEQIKNELGQDFHTWEFIKKKFMQDEVGNYYNERMAAEIRKREKYSESRRNNRTKNISDNTCKTHDKDMNNTPGIETETDIKGDKEGGKGEEKEGGFEFNHFPDNTCLEMV